MKIKLTANGDGSYTEVGTDDVTWVRDSYTEPRETIFDCDVCDQPIFEWELWTCLDGGEAAHTACVEVVTP